MRTVVIFKDNTEHARPVLDYLRDFEMQTGKQLETLDPDTQDGASFCRTYDIVEYPSIVALSDDGLLQTYGVDCRYLPSASSATMPSKKSLKKASDSALTKIYSFMLGGGLLGLVASFVLTIEQFHLAKNPDAVLQCSINLVLNCGTVMQSAQGEIFGFPNMIIGLMAFPVIMTVAIAGLFGTKFPQLFMRIANVVVAIGALLAYWMFFDSVYVIQTLCPWCLLVTFTMTVLLFAFTHYNATQKNLCLSKKRADKVASFFSGGYSNFAFAVFIVLLFAIVYLKFGNSLFM